MIKHLKRALLLMAAMLGIAATATAQGLPPVPVDPDVRIGHLDNGLTYYIRHNETPKGQADFYIAQKVGSILENDNQRGLAHFLEHMCFNGTENFPGNGIIDWLESVGVKFGQNLNAYTSVDQTVYNISNVPVERTSVQDSCLLILHDWACALSLEGEEIDKERGVIHQEWRRSMAGQMRIIENLLPTMYPNNKYGERLPIGTMEVVDNFPYEALRDYYHTWYRPDQQGIIVVGDIDVDYIEGKIKEMFGPIPMPTDAQAREYLPVEDTPGTIYAIGSDPEQTNIIMQLMFKTDAFPNEMKGNSMYVLTDYLIHMVEVMLDQRLTDLGKTPDAPFAQAGADYGNFFLAKTKDAFNVVVIPKGNESLQAFEAVYRELLRAQRHGFTITEYDRARSEYLSGLEKWYNGREKRQNEAYVQEYVDNFLDNEPIPSAEDKFQLMNMLVPNIPVDAINQILPELITNDNRVFLGLFPQKEGIDVPTDAQVAEIVAKVDAEEIEAYKEEVKTEPLIPALPAPGKVVATEYDAQWDCEALTLSNGVKVYVKHTDYKKDEILFTAVAIGGTSTIGDDKANELMFMPYAASQHGLGDYTSTDMQRYLSGKQANVSLSLDDYNREVTGSSTVKDLPTLMELIYMTFTDFAINEQEYKAMQNMISSALANQALNPQFIFQRDMTKAFYKSAASQVITSEAVNAANREAILDIIHSSLANAADYTFYFVGDVTVEQITPLLEQYIATLPADAKKKTTEYVVNADREITPGTARDTFTTKMETPQTWVAIVVEGDMPYTAKNKKISSMVGQILSNRLLKTIREEMGAVYSIGAVSNMKRQGKYNTLMQIPFPMKPEMKEQALSEIDKMVHAMTADIKAEELNPVKEFMVKSANEDREQNDGWLGQMVATQLNGVDVMANDVETINSVTIEDVQNFMKDFLGQGNYRIALLDPEE
ncbi:MAG: insulinase family protein [Clostridium sp.]|nr:insulinase family protein [Clostridium sp.]